MKDTLGDRMKSYEDCYRIKLPKRSYVMIRVDGKAFHTYTKGLNRPFDVGLIDEGENGVNNSFINCLLIWSFVLISCLLVL